MADFDVKELHCEPCATEDKWIPVEGFCEVCKEYLCEICLGVHRKQTMTRCHPIKDKAQMPSLEISGKYANICTDVCSIHRTEIVKYYCKDHDTTGCGDCMILKHTQCNKERLQDVSQDFKDTNTFKTVQTALNTYFKEIEETQNAVESNLKSMTTTYNRILKEIADLRKKVNDHLDSMQKQVTELVEKMLQSEENCLKTFEAKSKSLKTEVEEMLQKLAASSKNANSLFIATKQIEKKLTTIETELQVIKKDQLQQKQQQQDTLQQYMFVPSTEIENIISEEVPLGKLVKTTEYQSKIKEQNQQQDAGQLNKKKSDLYKGEISVNDWSDRKDTFVGDSVLLSQDIMVVTEYNNRAVKLIDIYHNTVIHNYYHGEFANGVTAINPSQVAITLPLIKKIQFLNVKSTLTKSHEINLQGQCSRISHKNKKLAVLFTGPQKIEIINLTGQVLYTVPPSSLPNRFNWLDSVIFGHDDETLIFTSWATNEVHAITFTGKTLCSYRNRSLEEPSCVQITENGVLLVNSTNKCLHVVSQGFLSSRTILQDEDDLKYFGKFSYCETDKKLYVCCGTIQIFDLKNVI